jgi:thiamine biosynthesis lipoprotein
VKPDGTPWWVTIETPPGPADDREGFLVALHDLAIATSGDYRRSFQHDGRRYGHTLDPRTGWPIEESVASVTVLHHCCMHADALATMLAVLGPSVGLDHAARYGLAALILTRDGTGELQEQMSPAFVAMLD